MGRVKQGELKYALQGSEPILLKGPEIFRILQQDETGFKPFHL